MNNAREIDYKIVQADRSIVTTFKSKRPPQGKITYWKDDSWNIVNNFKTQNEVIIYSGESLGH